MTGVLAWREGLWLRISDLFYHVAAVQSLLVTNQPLVTDPMFGVRGLPVDPTAGTFHTFLALDARLGGAGGFQVFEWLEPVVVALYFLVFYAFARRILRSAPKGFAALAIFAGVVWLLDFRVVIYPKWIDPAVYWAGLFFFLLFLERLSWPALTFACLLGVTTALVHLGTAELWVLTIGAAVVWSLLLVRKVEGGPVLAARCGLGAGISAVTMAPIVYVRSAGILTGARTSVFNPPPDSPMSGLPFASIGKGLGIIRGGALSQWYQGGDLMLAFVVVALVVVVMRAARRGATPETVLLAATASIMPALMLNLVGTKLLVAKFWFHLRRLAYELRFVPALLVPYVWSAGRRGLADRRAGRGRGTGALVAAAAAAVMLGTAALAGVEAIGVVNRFVSPLSIDNFERSRYNAVAATAGVVGYLATHSNPTQTVAASEKTSYYLTALVPIRVIAVRRAHMPLAVEVKDGPARRWAQLQLFNPRVTRAKTARLLDTYRVSHVVAPRDEGLLAKFRGMHELRRVYADRRYVVFAVDTASQ